MESFLLLEDQSGSISLGQWLANHVDKLWTAELKERRRILRQAGTILRRMHEACCYLPDHPDGSLVVDTKSVEGLELVLLDIDRIRKRRNPSRVLVKHNLGALRRTLEPAKLSRADLLRIVLSYLGQRSLSMHGKELVRDLEQ
jgi:hypothetical protein